MVPPTISDTFEALEQIGSQLGQGAKQVPKAVVRETKQSLGLGPAEQKPPPPQEPGIEGGTGGKVSPQAKQAQDQQIQELEAISKQKATKRYKEIQEQILLLAHKRQQELPKQVTGKPGFSEEKMVRQLEEQKKPEAEREAEKKKEEPLWVQRAKRKAEMVKGVSG
jgi:hypothetical protein